MRLVDARDAMRPPGSPRRGGSGRLNIQPRGSAPRERDHGGGDHPVPFRTRQLSPPSPRVLRSSPWEARESRSRRALVLCARGTARGRLGGPGRTIELRPGPFCIFGPYAGASTFLIYVQDVLADCLRFLLVCRLQCTVCIAGGPVEFSMSCGVRWYFFCIAC